MNDERKRTVKLRSMFVSLATAMALLGGAVAHAKVPPVFTLQGILHNSQGGLQTMAVTVTASFYDGAADDANLLFSSTPFTNVPVNNGLFSIPITFDAAAMAKIAGAPSLWVAVNVGNDVYPRQPVTPVVSALTAGTADNANALGGQPASFFVDTSSTQTIGGNKSFSGTVSGTFRGNGAGLTGIPGAGLVNNGAHLHGLSISYQQGPTVTITNGGKEACSASCPGNTFLVGGACTTGFIDRIQSSYMNSSGQYCCFASAAGTGNVFATAVCLGQSTAGSNLP
jgi:hypothetical protein